MTPRLRRSLENALLVAVPVATLALWPPLLAAKGPYWLGQNSDPDYPYLLNALAVAEGHAPYHVDHPGTTVHLLGAALLRAYHRVAGGGALADDVVRRAETYLLAFDWALLALYAAALALLALGVRRATGSVLAGVLAGATPLLSATVAAQVLCVKPEPLLAILAAGLGFGVALAAGREERRRSVSLALLVGALAGAALATKITAAPILLLPFLLLAGWRARAAFAAATAASAALLVAPARTGLTAAATLVSQIATHRGQYGKGEASFFDAGDYLAGLRSLLAADPLFTAGLLLGVLALAADRVRASRAPAALRTALLATLAGQAACLLVVARHPSPHYLLPALALTGLGAGLTLALLAHGRGRAWVVAQGALALVAVAWTSSVALRGLHHDLAAARDRQLAVVRDVERLGPAISIEYYRCSSPAYALHFGNIYSGMLYSARAAAAYPNTYFYNVWFHAMDPRLDAAQASLRAGPVLLQGSPLDDAALAKIRLPGRWTRVAGNDLEAVYRLE